MSDNKNTLIAIALSAIILVGWQYFFGPKDQPIVPQITSSVTATTTEATSAPAQPVLAANTASAAIVSSITNLDIKSFTAESEKVKFIFDNDLSFKDALNTNASYPFRSIVESDIPLKIFVFINDKPVSVPMAIVYDEQKKEFTGKNEALQLNFLARVDESGRFKFSLTSINPYRYQIVFNSTPKTFDGGHIRQFLLYGNDVERHTVGDEKTADGTYKWFGVDFRYHLFTLVLNEKAAVRYGLNKDGKMNVDIVNPANSFSGYVYFSRKNYDDLKAVGDNLHLAVDFGFFAIVAVPILRGLQFFYKLVPNYGIAIILLTLFIRTLMFPLQYKSFKSMKKMQILTPEINKLKEKFKDDPARLQKETMDLFKRGGANPLSGCLPLVAQLPIFFAFYQVLNSSVELVNAPFFGWLQDLSLKDPYYVLPVLMTISMFFQQKMTPNTSMDKMQQRIMLFMPLIFGFIMKDLSSGLVLYIFVSTMYGIAQQLFVYKVQKD